MSTATKVSRLFKKGSKKNMSVLLIQQVNDAHGLNIHILRKNTIPKYLQELVSHETIRIF
jgi:hypothetical protein